MDGERLIYCCELCVLITSIRTKESITPWEPMVVSGWINKSITFSHIKMKIGLISG